MATTEEILAAAQELGKLITKHPKSQRMHKVLEQFEADPDAQRLFLDYHRQLGKIAEKESKGEPVEVDDKKSLQELQDKVVANDLIREYQVAQMDYMDLMRQVDDQVGGSAEPKPQQAPPAAT